MIFVPLKRKCLATSEDTELAPKSKRRKDSVVAGIFDTGTDSPGIRQYFSGSVFEILLLFTCEHALVDYAVTS